MRIVSSIMIVMLCTGFAFAQEPLFERRALYCPAHFGNSYEVMGALEMEEMLCEAKHWGFNRYGDWYDTVDCADPFVDKHYNMAQAMWDKKKTNFLSAQAAGLECELIITPNHVYLDQCRTELLATKKDRIFGQLICPSKPEARAIILKNYENLFVDLAKAGVKLKALCPCPYDYGGCACENCAPWILTFAQLTREIWEVAVKHHPDIEMQYIGWWWSAEEHKLFAEWADATYPGWVKGISLHIPYGKRDVADVPLPKGCARQAFVHNGYADQAQPRDVYGHLGPVIASKRLPETLAALKAHGVNGFMAYSEGIYEDVNKAVLGGIASGTYATSEEALTAYAKRYFDADDALAKQWVDWLVPWGAPFEVDAAAAQESLKTLSATTDASDWRVQQWAFKAEFLALHAKIMTETEWTETRVANADAYWAAREKMDRKVYGLGPVRHILNKRFSPLPWHNAWSQYSLERRQMQSEM